MASESFWETVKISVRLKDKSHQRQFTLWGRSGISQIKTFFFFFFAANHKIWSPMSPLNEAWIIHDVQSVVYTWQWHHLARRRTEVHTLYPLNFHFGSKRKSLTTLRIQLTFSFSLLTFASHKGIYPSPWGHSPLVVIAISPRCTLNPNLTQSQCRCELFHRSTSVRKWGRQRILCGSASSRVTRWCDIAVWWLTLAQFTIQLWI